jgi:hypothetical protein
MVRSGKTVSLRNPDAFVKKFLSHVFYGVDGHDIFTAGLWRVIDEQVSSYALTGPGEFVAEVFVKIINGTWKNLDPRIVQLYNRLCGPWPVQDT